ncbi:hypothetical protein DTO027I6_9671 [Penicillium roqueforti]|nr:hypothetical protein CBS147337_9815 [Penicillium roqueforti]KAI3185682.1 hypothetical protein DTO027I6_9671 [Penicillium roqueforti]
MMTDNWMQMSPSLPKSLKEEYTRLRDLFEIGSDQLKLITSKFLEELELGLRTEESDIPMNPTWVTSFPAGTESGQYLTLDLGGTNLRVCRVDLHGSDREYDVIRTEHRIPEDLKSSTAKHLWKFIASCLRQFFDQHSISVQAAQEIPLAFTFSYPVTQHSLSHGLLQRWTKGFNISGVEGRDVVKDLGEALDKEVRAQRKSSSIHAGSIIVVQALPLRIVALVNDTVDPEDEDFWPLLRCVDGNQLYDVEIDQSSPRPGQQRYEKLVAGHYLGEMMRLILADLYDRHKIFQGRNGSGLKQPYVLDSCSLANIENDQTRSLTSIRNMLQETFNITSDFSESYFSRCVARLISRRSVRLYACGIAALLKKRGMQHCHVAVDGSVFSKYPGFPDRVMEALKEVLGLPEGGDDHIRLVPAVDGSSVGAAVIAAVAMAREEEGCPGI